MVKKKIHRDQWYWPQLRKGCCLCKSHQNRDRLLLLPPTALPLCIYKPHHISMVQEQNEQHDNYIGYSMIHMQVPMCACHIRPDACRTCYFNFKTLHTKIIPCCMYPPSLWTEHTTTWLRMNPAQAYSHTHKLAQLLCPTTVLHTWN